MLHLGDAHAASLRSDPGRASRRRRVRAFVGCAALAVALHLAMLDGIGSSAARPFDASATPLSVRTIAAEPAAPAPEPQPTPSPVATALTAAPERAERPHRRAPSLRASAMNAIDEHPQAAAQVSAGSPAVHAAAASSPVVVSAIEQRPIRSAAEIEAVAANPAQEPAATGASNATAPAMPGMGDHPPPIYPTRLPPAATLHYEVRRGFLRGDGEIRWRPEGHAYRLVLEASVAGLTLLVQTSEGAVERDGLQPIRFLDQRARRAAQAANFVRERGRITFSGTAVEWPLVGGVQDRLSWMIQLAGIVAADPALLHEGSRITMAVVGARGDADVWSLRYAGEEAVETSSGRVAAFKLVREGHAPNDTTAEVWLDPARSYLPVRATLGNGSGAPEYDLLLSRIDP